MREHIGSALRPGGALRGWSARIVALTAFVAVLVPLAALHPGTVRLVLLQPARDLMFFGRELQPLRHFLEIERVHPEPTLSAILPATAARDSVDLAVDLWLPDRNPAPVAVLLHGSSPRGRTLGFNRLLAAHLQAAGWFVVSPDMRGFGDSGKPDDRGDPLQWRHEPDVLRIAQYALAHPRSDGRIVAIGHSTGGSVALRVTRQEHTFSAVVAIGPARTSREREPGFWERMRFSSDRRMSRLAPRPIVRDSRQHYSVPGLAMVSASGAETVPVLLLDGEREGEALIRMLRNTADAIGESAAHVTVPQAHHYCGAYQLPLGRAVYVRRAVFDECVAVVLAFLSRIVR